MQVYESMTADNLEQRMLTRVDPSLDKREGSIIYDATAPAAMELAEAYIMARVILKEAFITTADRAFLMLRAAEYSIYPTDPTTAEVLGQFNQDVALGSRFTYPATGFVYAVKSQVDATVHTYRLVCETAGAAGNDCIGDILPVTSIDGLTSAKIIELITPGEDEEDTEVFRARVIRELNSKAFGGNGDDYKEKVLAIDGIGGVKVYRCWNGGGTVKLVILNSEYSTASTELVADVQEKMDPPPQGKGYGLAPIGHTVTVVSATAVAINVEAELLVKTGYTIDDVLTKAKENIGSYLQTRRKAWTDESDRENLVIRTAYILDALLNTPLVEDVTNVTANGAADHLALASDEVPILGTVTLKAVSA